MTNLQMIETLCSLVEQQSEIIRHLSTELAHARNLTFTEVQMVTDSRKRYSEILGDEEIPDELDTD